MCLFYVRYKAVHSWQINMTLNLFMHWIELWYLYCSYMYRSNNSISIVHDSMNVNVSAFFPPECIYPEYSSTYMSYKNLVWNNISCPIFIIFIKLPLCLLIQIWINPFWPPCVIAFSKIIFLKAVWNIFWLKFTPKMRTNCYLSIDIYMSFLFKIY